VLLDFGYDVALSDVDDFISTVFDDVNAFLQVWEVLWAAGAMFIAGLVITFLLLVLKALLELVGVLLAIEDNTRDAVD